MSRSIHRRTLIAAMAGALVLPALTLPAAEAQQTPLGAAVPSAGPDSLELVDRVAAVVGDTSVLLSEVREEVLRMQASGVQIPRDPAALERLLSRTLDNLVDRAILLERAEQEGVRAPPDEVRARAEEEYQRRLEQFPSQQAFRNAVERSGQNMFQFREMLRTRAWEELTLGRFRQELMQSGDLPTASVSDEEVRQYFEANAARAQRPATVSFERVMIAPEPDSTARDSAIGVARKAYDEIQDGTDFAVAARRYSQDPGSRDEGGDLGWIRRADVVPLFASAAFRAPPGRTVGPVRTRFGYHLIKVINSRGSERHLRHILVRPEIDEDDVERGRELAEAVADSLRQGVDAGHLAQRHGVYGEDVLFQDVNVPEITDRFGEAYLEAIQNRGDREVVGPFRVEGPFQVPTFVILRVTDHREAGSYELEEVRNNIHQQLMRQKQFQKYVEELRHRMFVRILI